jgi:hypothetical protein
LGCLLPHLQPDLNRDRPNFNFYVSLLEMGNWINSRDYFTGDRLWHCTERDRAIGVLKNWFDQLERWE